MTHSIGCCSFLPCYCRELPEINSTPRIDAQEFNRQLQLSSQLISCKILHLAGNRIIYYDYGGVRRHPGWAPLSQQCWLGLSPTRIHALKFNFSLAQLGAVVATQLGKLTTTGGGDKQPRWRLLKNTAGVLWGGSQFFHPNTLWGKHGTQT